MDWTDPITVDEMYGPWPIEKEALTSTLDRSLSPRSRDSLYDTVAEVGLGADDIVLDIGARDARHSIRLVERFECTAVAIDPVERNVMNALAAVDAQSMRDRIEVRRGGIEDIPAADHEFDLVFCRDMFVHIADPTPALSECRRVLKSGGHMVFYQTFATDLLEPAEAIQIYRDLAVVAERMSVADFERRVLAAGYVVESVDPIGSEWREAWEEDGTGTTSRQLLRTARMLRAKDAMVGELGELAYRIELANALWGIYQMIGKLEPRVYVLRSP